PRRRGGSRRRRFVELVPDLRGVRLLQQERTHHERDRGDDDRVVEAGVEVLRRRRDVDADQRQEATEDAVADVVWQRQRRVAHFGWERLHEIGGDRPVHHRDEDHLQEDVEDQQREVRRLLRNDRRPRLDGLLAGRKGGLLPRDDGLAFAVQGGELRLVLALDDDLLQLDDIGA